MIQIRIQGCLDQSWAEEFKGFSISYEGKGITLLEGDVKDEAALNSILRTLSDLNLPLISLTRSS